MPNINKNENNTEKIISKLKEKMQLEKIPPEDHAKYIGQGLLSTIPVLGGFLSSLFGSYMPDLRQKRFITFFHELQVDVHKIKDKLDGVIENIQNNSDRKEEFSYLFEKIVKSVIENYQKEKIDCFKAILINSLIQTDVETEEKEFFLNLVNEMTVTHIRFIKLLYDPDEFIRQHPEVSPGGEIGGRFSIFQRCFPDMSEGLIMGVISYLDSRYLARDIMSGMRTTLSSTNVSQIRDLLTGFGKKFVEFITLPG